MRYYIPDSRIENPWDLIILVGSDGYGKLCLVEQCPKRVLAIIEATNELDAVQEFDRITNGLVYCNELDQEI